MKEKKFHICTMCPERVMGFKCQQYCWNYMKWLKKEKEKDEQ